jgi:hypothetical protein
MSEPATASPPTTKPDSGSRPIQPTGSGTSGPAAVSAALPCSDLMVCASSARSPPNADTLGVPTFCSHPAPPAGSPTAPSSGLASTAPRRQPYSLAGARLPVGSLSLFAERTPTASAGRHSGRLNSPPARASRPAVLGVTSLTLSAVSRETSSRWYGLTTSRSAWPRYTTGFPGRTGARVSSSRPAALDGPMAPSSSSLGQETSPPTGRSPGHAWVGVECSAVSSSWAAAVGAGNLRRGNGADRGSAAPGRPAGGTVNRDPDNGTPREPAAPDSPSANGTEDADPDNGRDRGPAAPERSSANGTEDDGPDSDPGSSALARSAGGSVGQNVPGSNIDRRSAVLSGSAVPGRVEVRSTGPDCHTSPRHVDSSPTAGDSSALPAIDGESSRGSSDRAGLYVTDDTALGLRSEASAAAGPGSTDPGSTDPGTWNRETSASGAEGPDTENPGTTGPGTTDPGT